MKRNAMILLGALLVPTLSYADNVGGCGWGSKLFDGQKGVAPQVLAVTTNGTFGNQTFGISSGTSGCTQNGTVESRWKTAAYIDSNMNRLALDASRGQGESLTSLAALVGIDSADQGAFDNAVHKNFAMIFTSPDVSSTDVAASLRNVLASDEVLSKYAANV